MSQINDLIFVRQITQNQLWRSTWEAEYQGQKCIAKKIELEDQQKKEKLIQILGKQVRLSSLIQPEDRSQLVLFNEMVESEQYVAFLRDWVEGKPLDELLSPEPLPWDQAVCWIEAIAKVVDLAHNQYSMFHGDLKPANIIFGENGEVSIIDWDSVQIASETDDLAEKTLSMEAIGTPFYMAPEQCSGRKITEKCDVYALGVILYRLLTGKLPFENVPVLELWTVKQTTPLQSIFVSFPQLELPSEIGLLVDDALLMDPNFRVPSVQEFLSRLHIASVGSVSGNQSQVKASISERTDIPTPPPVRNQAVHRLSDKEILEDKTPTGPITLVGHTQAGKTVLAAGLCSTFSENFSVTPLDDETRNFVNNTKSILDAGAWPGATQGTVADLRFKLLLRGAIRKRAAIVAFKEYGGERVSQKNYYQDIVGVPEGVLLLFNPFTLQKRDAYGLNKLVTETKGCIDYLSKLPRKPQVAVVITAADTLEGSAKEFKPKFERIVKEITTTLSLSNFDWKRFEVSVCKPLADQTRPQLDPQHIEYPFIWLLDKKQFETQKQTVARWLFRLTVAALIFLCIAFGTWQMEHCRSTGITGKIASIEKRYLSRSSVDGKEKYYLELDALVKDLPKKGFWFDSQKDAFQKATHGLYAKTDQAHYDWFSARLRVQGSKGSPLEEFTRIGQEIDQWEPYLKESTQALKDKLKVQQAQELPERIRFCVKWVKDAQGESEELKKRYTLVKTFVERFQASNPEVKTVFRTEIAPLYLVVLENRIKGFAGKPEELAKLINDCRTYYEEDLKENFDSSPLAKKLIELVEARVKIETDSILSKVKDTSTAFNFDDTILKQYLELVQKGGFSKDDVRLVILSINSFCEGIQGKRVEAEKTVVADFLRSIEHVDGKEAVDRLKGWLRDNSYLAPESRSSVEQVVYQKVFNYVDMLIKPCLSSECTEKHYVELKEFCNTIKAVKSDYFQKSPLFTFASMYVNWYDNESTLTISIANLKASCSYNYNYSDGSDNRYGGVLYSTDSQYGTWSSSRFLKTKETLSTPKMLKKVKPWETFDIQFRGIVTGWYSDDNDFNSTYTFKIFSRNDTSYSFGGQYIDVDIVFQIQGKTLEDLLDEVAKVNK